MNRYHNETRYESQDELKSRQMLRGALRGISMASCILGGMFFVGCVLIGDQHHAQLPMQLFIGGLVVLVHLKR